MPFEEQPLNITVSPVPIPSDPEPICIVVHADVRLEPYQRRQLLEHARRHFTDTKWSRIPIFVTDPLVTIDVLRAPPEIDNMTANQDSLILKSPRHISGQEFIDRRIAEGDCVHSPVGITPKSPAATCPPAPPHERTDPIHREATYPER